MELYIVTLIESIFVHGKHEISWIMSEYYTNWMWKTYSTLSIYPWNHAWFLLSFLFLLNMAWMAHGTCQAHSQLTTHMLHADTYKHFVSIDTSIIIIILILTQYPAPSTRNPHIILIATVNTFMKYEVFFYLTFWGT